MACKVQVLLNEEERREGESNKIERRNGERNGMKRREEGSDKKGLERESI